MLEGEGRISRPPWPASCCWGICSLSKKAVHRWQDRNRYVRGWLERWPTPIWEACPGLRISLIGLSSSEGPSNTAVAGDDGTKLKLRIRMNPSRHALVTSYRRVQAFHAVSCRAMRLEARDPRTSGRPSSLRNTKHPYPWNHDCSVRRIRSCSGPRGRSQEDRRRGVLPLEGARTRRWSRARPQAPRGVTWAFVSRRPGGTLPLVDSEKGEVEIEQKGVD